MDPDAGMQPDGGVGPDGGAVFCQAFADRDGDGHGDVTRFENKCEATLPAGWVRNFDDCDDSDGQVHPGATDTCNGKDDDCDGDVDGLAGRPFVDLDADGFGDARLLPADSCRGGDCDDNAEDVHPGAAEICNSVDDDCNGQVDEGLPVSDKYVDCDLDFMTAKDPVSMCGVDASAVCGGFGAVLDRPSVMPDCDDHNRNISPIAKELCKNHIDDDCDGEIDEALSVDICNGEDDDCDGEVDEEVSQLYVLDCDGDGFPSSAPAVKACEEPELPEECKDKGAYRLSGYQLRIDCVDSDARAYPGQRVAQSSPIAGVSEEVDFDFDCDGQETPLVKELCPATGCGETGRCWLNQVPACGALGVIHNCLVPTTDTINSPCL
jgi:hypothetical protein